MYRSIILLKRKSMWTQKQMLSTIKLERCRQNKNTIKNSFRKIVTDYE